MNIKENIVTSLKKLLRNKKNIYHRITVSICVIVLIGVFLFYNNMQRFINASENSNIEFRTLSVPRDKGEKDLGLSKIQNIEHIEFVYNSLYSQNTLDSNLKNEKVDGMITLKVTSDAQLKKLTGKELLKNTDSGGIICPKNFYPDSNVGDLKINEKEMIDGDTLIGKEIKVNYFTRKLHSSIIVRDEEIEQTFKVLGTYNSKSIMEINNVCFVSYKDMIELLDRKIMMEINKSSYYWYVIVDDLNNVELVKAELKKIGMGTSNNQTSIDNNQVRTIKQMLIFIVVASVIALVSITTLYTSKKLEQESYNIGLLRALGYKQKEISKSYLIENLVNSIIIIMIGSLLTALLFALLYIFIFRYFNYIGFTVKLDIMSFLLSFIIIMIMDLITSYIIINIKVRKNITELIGEKL